MCLLSISTTEEREEFFRTRIDEKGLTVYKAVLVKSDGYYSPFIWVRYKEGEDQAQQKALHTGNVAYLSGFHFYKDRFAAEKLCNALNSRTHRYPGLYKIIECIVKKEWITEIGFEADAVDFVKDIVIVAKKAIFPKYSEED